VITLQSGAGGASPAAAAAAGSGAAGAASADSIGGGGDSMMAQDVNLMRIEMIGKRTLEPHALNF
jgi:hypothetical protein